MSTGNKNRFQFDGEEAVTGGFEQSPGFSAPADEHAPDIYYLDEPEMRFQRKSRMGWFILAGLLLILGSGVAFWYFKVYQDENTASDLNERFSRVDQEYRDRYFVPEEKVSSSLANAIDLYRSQESHQAKLAFEIFIDSSGTNQEKSIAEVFLGILAMERGRLTLAEHHFLRALRFTPQYLPALVNMAIVKRKAGDYEQAKKYAEQARDIAPREARVAALLGNILAESSDTEGAIDAYDTALQSDPHDATSHYNKGLTLLRAQRLDEAILSFSRAAERGDGRLQLLAHAQLAQIYVSRNQLELARHHLQKAVSIAPDNGKYYYNLGVVELRMGENQAAQHSFERALESGSNDIVIYRSLATAFENMQQPSRAIQALQRALYLNSADLPSLFALAGLYSRQKNLLQAEDVYKRIVNITPGDQNTEEALLRLAAVYTEMERHNDAIAILEKARTLNPNELRTYYVLGQVYDKAGQRHLALDAWKKAIALHEQSQVGGSTRPLSRAEERQLRLAIGATYVKEGAADLALREYRQIQAINQQNPPIQLDSALDLAFGDAYLMMRDYQNAIASLQKAVQDDRLKLPERKRAYIQLALAYQKQSQTVAGSLEEARAWANKAARLDPLDPEPQMMQAGILMETESLVDREKAIEVLQAVTQSDLDAPVASRAWNLLGLGYMQNGEYKRALQAFDYAVQLDPSNKEAYQNQRVAAKNYESSL
ncbi:MAG: tetratricopeptide repeat protein [Leptospiraceae bacterium]|nr:tetratricopeptide repeat protein [Leptospiraceae bacterium]